MVKKVRSINPGQIDLFTDWLVAEQPAVSPVVEIVKKSKNESRYALALKLAEKLNIDGEITSRFLTAEADIAFGGSQAKGTYLMKDAYEALEVAFNIHLLNTEDSGWTVQNTEWARNKVIDLTNRIQKLPTQTKRDEEMDEFQQFSTPPTLSFVANWVAKVGKDDIMAEPSAGTGDLAIWSKIAGAEIVLNELSQRRHALLAALFPEAKLFKENAEQLDNVLPPSIAPTVIVMNPPFSSTAGRVQGQRDTSNGARHIEQALKRLEDGGRLVAIVGNGMSMDRPGFSQWWKDIQQKYNVLANIGISGKEYAKYGTTFDNQILVIDKTGPTQIPILIGQVESVADLPTLLESIRNERQPIQSRTNKSTVIKDTQSKPDPLQSGNRTGRTGAGEDGARVESIGDGNRGADITDSQTSGITGVSNVADDGIRAGDKVRSGSVGGGQSGGSGSDDSGRNSSVPEGNSATNIAIEAKSGEVFEFTDSVFATYTPQRLTIPGAKSHPGKLVQSAAMSAVEPPAPTYAPMLPSNIIQDGLLSIAQLESVVYAGQAHSELLPNGARKGFFIGDGTGVGKGREISGIILDNMMQGRKKAVWVSFNEGLIDDARRDFAGVGGDPNKIFFQGKTKAGNEITQEEGILFTTYSTLRGGEKKQANDLGQKSGKTRAQQIIDWLGEGFDGAILFDEAHSMGNAIAIRGKRGVRKPSQQAIAGINLQRELPNARITYVSATGATEISNLSYADRLGLWGEGTPFADTNDFISNVSKGGIASMELISRDMKAMGMYLSRSLSYDGVTYERMEHTLSELQEDIYNELAGAWQLVLNNVEEALFLTQAGKSGSGKSAAMSQFWGAHQRFFNQIITAMQTPSVIDDIRKQLDAGNVAVIQLVNTNEAAQERIIADATANNEALEDLDFTPRQMLMDYVRNGFPVAVYEESTDANGNTVYVPVKDSEGNQVFDREAIALREALLETLQQIRVPENPLDSIINAFGSDRVAEVTGRSRRFVQVRDDEGNFKVVEEKRGKNSSRADAAAFMSNKKDILVFSGAGGTGYSFHADNTAENQRRRYHYILQPGWRADGAVQGFGRTHRTNQANEPHYILPTTNLKAQKRFVSSIARRLDQLGALTRGQREATSQGMFTAADNLESQYAVIALNNFFGDLYRGKTDLSFQDITKQMGLNLLDQNASFSQDKIPPIPQFLNRLLSLKTDQQNAVFAEFEKRLTEAVEYAKQQGIFDVGLQTMSALSIKKTRDDVAYTDKNTGAQTRYVELAVTNEIIYNEWEDAKKLAKKSRAEGDISGWFVSEFGRNKGDVFLLNDIGERLDSEGKSVRRGVMHTIRKHGHRYIDNADAISRGWEFRQMPGGYQRVTLTRAIDESEAEKLWKEQLGNAPKTEVKTERMVVGVILPIWDRVVGEETIKRLQTDDGEQLLGRMLGSQSAKQTIKNFGLESGLSGMSSGDLFKSIRSGNKAILSNGWEVTTAKVNFEDRIEIKGRSSFTDAEKRILKEQGAFIERISWADRVFIPNDINGVGVFVRITASRPVVDLIEKSKSKDVTDTEDEQNYGIPQMLTANENAIPDTPVGEPITKSKNINNQQGVISMAEDKKPFHVTVAEKLIDQLEKGTAPWQKPWKAGEIMDFLPYNPKTGNRYKGINSIYLLSQERDDPRWMTYNQAKDAGGQVLKGEKGTPIQYWKFSEEHNKRDEAGNLVLDSDGEPVKVVVSLERPRVFFATVFNGEQIEGLPPLERKEQEWDAIERAENVLKGSGATIKHSLQARAFYRSSTDSIHLPDKGQFPTADNYYATALHELGHWTGHESRLNRDLNNPFGSEAYAKEELRAEIASMIIGSELGIGHDPSQHVAYVGSWIKALQEDPMEIFRAAADAEKIQGYLLGLEQKQVQEKTSEQNQADEQSLILAELQELHLSLSPEYSPLTSWKNLNATAQANGLLAEINRGINDGEMPPPYVISYSDLNGNKIAITTDLYNNGKAANNINGVRVPGTGLTTVLEWQSAAFTNAVSQLRSQVGEDEMPKINNNTVIYKVGGPGEVNVYGFGASYEEAIKAAIDNEDVTFGSSHINQVVPEANALPGALAFRSGIKDSTLKALQEDEFVNWEELELNDLTAGDIESYVVGEIKKEIEKLNPSEDARMMVSEVECTNIAIKQILEKHELAKTPGFIEELKSVDYGNIRERIIGTREIIPIHERIIGTIEAKDKPLSVEALELVAKVNSFAESINAVDTNEDQKLEQALKSSMRQSRIPGMENVQVPDPVAVDLLKSPSINKLAEELTNQGINSLQPLAGGVSSVVLDAGDGRVVRLGFGSLTKTPNIPEILQPLAFGEIGNLRYEVMPKADTQNITDTDVQTMITRLDQRGYVFSDPGTDNLGKVGNQIVVIDPGAVSQIKKELTKDDVEQDTTKQQPEKTILNVPFKEKEEAKALGAKWDRQEKTWYVPSGVNLEPFSKWMKPSSVDLEQTDSKISTSESPADMQQAAAQVPQRQYLAVPYEARILAKEAGALWDKAEKSWYAGHNADMTKLERWLPDNVAAQQGPAMQPREEFEDVLRELGCIVSGEHPIMDGKKHRILVKGEEKKRNDSLGSGFYVAHLDGKPNGYAINNKTGNEKKWKAKGYSLSAEEKTQIHADAAAKLKARDDEALRLQERSSKAIGELLAVAPIAPPTHKYLVGKQALPNDLKIVPENTDALPRDTIIKIGSDWKESKKLREDNPEALVFTAGDLLMSGQDVGGKIWTAQSIQQNGSKCNLKDSRKEACFHIVGGDMDALAKAPVLVIGEGYATADSSYQALGFPIVSAFDSGNLPHVAKLLHEKFPEKPVVIIGDDDLKEQLISGKNPGRIKADEAAAAVNGKAVFPIFAPGEQAANVNLSDFNDLATKSILGKEGVKRQLKAIVDDVINKHQTKIEQKNVQIPEQKKRQAVKM